MLNVCPIEYVSLLKQAIVISIQPIKAKKILSICNLNDENGMIYFLIYSYTV